MAIMEEAKIENCNTVEYWNGIWKKYRHDDKPSYIAAVSRNVCDRGYWDESFKNPQKHVKYSVYRSYHFAKQLQAQSILDVGCGNGRLLYGMKTVLPNADLFGIDFSDVGIARMQKEYGISGSVMDVYELSKLNRKFDFVVVNDVLEHVKDEERFLQGCIDVLSDDGSLYLGIPNDILGPEDTAEHLRKYTVESVKELLDNFFDDYIIETIDIHIIALCKARTKKTISC